MTRRKPPEEKIDAWVERQTREATEQGLFEDLPGTGKPIADLDRPYDPNWWVKAKLRRERVSALPDALALRAYVEKALAKALALETEEALRAALAELNARIRSANAQITVGPPSTVVPLDVERTVERWRSERKDRT